MCTRGTQSQVRSSGRRATHRRSVWRSRLTAAVLAAACSVCAKSSARAQAAAHGSSVALPSAALFATGGQRARNVRELDARIRRALAAQSGVRLTATPGLDLAAVGLALDCMDESVQCLRRVAAKIGVDVLVAPSLERGQGDLVLTLLYFDARNTGALTRVVRWQSGEKLTPDTLDAVPELVRGLLPARDPAPSKPAPVVRSRAAFAKAAADSVAPSPVARPVLIAPWIILASGVVMLGAGVATGVAAQGNERELKAMLVRTHAEADAAARTRETAKTQATVANVFYGLGAAATLVGGGWLALDLIGDSGERDPRPGRSRAQLLPTLTPKQVGIVYRQQGSWL